MCDKMNRIDRSGALVDFGKVFDGNVKPIEISNLFITLSSRLDQDLGFVNDTSTT